MGSRGYRPWRVVQEADPPGGSQGSALILVLQAIALFFGSLALEAPVFQVSIRTPSIVRPLIGTPPSDALIPETEPLRRACS